MKYLTLILLTLLGHYSEAQTENFMSGDLSPRSLQEIALKGETILQKEKLLNKIERIAHLAELDTTEIYYHLQGNLVFDGDTSIDESLSFMFTYPKDYLFLDINNDGKEDMLFQSSGSFFDDSPTFIFFLSTKNGNYETISSNGRIVDVKQTSIQLPLRVEVNGIMVDYISYGCCAYHGWDFNKTDFISFDPSITFNSRDRMVNMRTVNRNNIEKLD